MEERKLYERLLELIDLSKDASEDECVSINHFKIKVCYQDEFKDLLETEKVGYLMQQMNEGNLTPSKYIDLITLCKSKLDGEDGLSYQRLLGILEKVADLNKSQIMEVNGYFIPREDYAEFNALCKKLKVGTYLPAKVKTNAELESMIHAKLQIDSNQRERINNYAIKKDEKVCPVNNEGILNITAQEYLDIYNVVREYANRRVPLDKIYEALASALKSREVASNIIDECAEYGFISLDDFSSSKTLTR